MVLRTIALLTVLGVLFLGGCNCQTYGPEPPRFKVCNLPRVADECAWFYADVQDLFFGVDYYQDMNKTFGGTLYR
jgi:hypothetical protein